MKAAVYNQYGSPDVVVQVTDVEKPAPKGNQVLIKVHAASLNPLDCGLPKGAGRFVTGFRKPKFTQLGVDIAGEVEAAGRNVTQFKPGDEVFGLCVRDPHASGFAAWMPQGAFAEYACVPESALVLKPDNVTFEQAAAVPLAGITALQGLRDKGHIQPRHKVLINGAAGGVGTFAVQIAKSLGAEVTGVCSTKNVDMVRSIGADRVIDYTREDLTIPRPQNGQPYDLILDCIGNHSLSACRRVLSSQGVLLMVGDKSGRGIMSVLARLIAALVLSKFGSQTLITFLAKPKSEDLAVLCNLMKAGKLKPIVDRCYRLSEIAEALRYNEQGHARGKLVIVM